MEIEFIGNYRQQNQGFCGSVYGSGGVSPGLRARDYKEPILVLIKVDNGQRKTNRNDKEVRQ